MANNKETFLNLTSDKRETTIYGLPADGKYRVEIEAFRVVDQDIDADGVIESTVAVAPASPYQPSPDVLIKDGVKIGGVTAGTIAGAINSLSSGGYLDTLAPPIPSGLALSSSITDTAASLTLTWNASTASDFATYIVAIKEGAGNFVEFQTTSPNYRRDGLTRNVICTAKVAAVDRAGNKSSFSSEVSITTARDTVAPGIVGNITASTTYETAFLKWGNPADTDIAGNKVELYRAGVLVNTLTTSATPLSTGNITLTGLTKASTYYVRISAFDTSGNYSAAVQSGDFTTAGGIVASDLVDGLAPVTTVTALPAVAGYTGTPLIMFNRDVYRIINGVWSKSVNGADVVASSLPGSALVPTTSLPSTISVANVAGLNTIGDAFKRADWSTVAGTGKPADNATADVSFQYSGNIAATNIEIAGNSLSKTGATSDWSTPSTTGDVIIPVQRYPGGMRFSWRGSYANYALAVGLLIGQNRYLDSLLFSIRTSGNTANFYLGTAIDGSGVVYDANTVFEIAYDNVNIYLRTDGVTRRTYPVASGLSYVPHSHFKDFGARMSDISFTTYTDNAWLSVGGVGRPENNATSGDNILPNSALLTDTTGWTLQGSISRVVATAGDPGNYFRGTANNAVPVSAKYPVPSGVSKLFFSYWKRSSESGQQVALDFTFETATGTLAGTQRFNSFVGAANVWTLVSGSVSLPANTARFALGPTLVIGSGQTHDIGLIRIGITESAATVGAPSGTMVGGTLSQDVETRANDPATRVNAGVTTITGGKITTGTITALQIAASTITATQIAASTITATQIAASTITATQIAANTITANQIAGATITANQLAANAVTADKIAANSIATNKLSVASRPISTIGINMRIEPNGSIAWDSGFIQYVSSTGDYASEVITANNAGIPSTITYFYFVPGSGVISSSSNESAVLNNSTFKHIATWSGGTALNMAAGVGTVLNGDRIVTGTINANKIVAASITSAQIAAGTITANNIQVGTISAAQLAAGAITATKLAIGTSDSIIPDSSFQDPAFWIAGNPAGVTFIPTNGSWPAAPVNLLNVVGDGGPRDWYTPFFEAEAGATYRIRAYYYTNANFSGWMNPVLHMPGFQWLSMKSGFASNPDTVDGHTITTPSGGVMFKEMTVTNLNSYDTKRWQFRFKSAFVGNFQFFATIIRVSDATLIADGAITTNKITVGSLNGDRITAGTLDANTIRAGTVLSNLVQVANTGFGSNFDLGAAMVAANNPAQRINQGTTTIGPGFINISGGTTLDNWRTGTQINGGAVSASSISADKLKIGARGVSTEGIDFYTSMINGGLELSWSPGAVRFTNGNGANDVRGTAGGNTYGIPKTCYIYWIEGESALRVTSNSGDVYGNTNAIMMATYDGAYRFNVTYGGTIIDGQRITTGSITADRMSVGSLSAISANIGEVTAGLIRSADNTASLNLGTKRLSFVTGDWRVVNGSSIGPNANMVQWFGPNSVAVGSETIANSRFALANDGRIYYGAAELGLGGGISKQTVGYEITLMKMLDVGASVSFEANVFKEAGGQGGTLQVVLYAGVAGQALGAVASANGSYVGPSEPGGASLTGTYTNNTGIKQAFNFQVSSNGLGGPVRAGQSYLSM